MKIKCENKVVCGFYACAYNYDGYCGHSVIAMDEAGKCVLARPKKEAKQKTSAPSDSSNM